MSSIIKVTLSSLGLRLENIIPNPEFCCSCLLNFCGYGPFLLCGWHWLKRLWNEFFTRGGKNLLTLVSRSKLKNSLAVFCWLRGCSRSSFSWISSCDFPWPSGLRWLRKTRLSANESTEIRALKALKREITLLSFCGNPFQDMMQTVCERRLWLLRRIWRLGKALEFHTIVLDRGHQKLCRLCK